jgi:Nucleotidyltransferase of unknown function (DUF6036)
MRSAVAELLADLAHALGEAGVSWYLFGAQAAILHGAARLTADVVDVTVRWPADRPQEALIDVLAACGFEPRVADPHFVQRTRVIPFHHRPTGLPLDIVMAGPGLEDLFFERVLLRDVEGVPVRVASPEDIVIMKVLAGRTKDIDDVVSILAVGKSLDIAMSVTPSKPSRTRSVRAISSQCSTAR